ncbi:MAG: hypothetical protein WD810_03390 [Solirubrobacterales bacterium]
MRRVTWWLIVGCWLASPLVRSRTLAELLVAGALALAVLKVVAAAFRGARRSPHARRLSGDAE